MSVKRPHDSDDDDSHQAQPQPAKRARTVDLESAKLWSELSEGDLGTRTNAAHALITKNCLGNPSPTFERAKRFALRLFSGLASGRHSARPGFYACLAGALSIRPHAFGCEQLKLENVVSALRKSTKVDKGLGKQAERDAHYGRVLGCKCLLDSGILLTGDAEAAQALEQVLQVLCETAKAKIWLAREVGWVLVDLVNSASCKGSHVHLILQTLHQHKLLKTKEGLAIWLTMAERFPKLQRITGAWIADHPLASGNEKTLARILADSAIAGDDELEDLGEHVWSPSLHFVWPVIFGELAKEQRPSKHISLSQFWSEVIEKTFLQATASSERKYTGLLAVAEMIKICRPGDYQHVFSKQVVDTMSAALNPSNDRNIAEPAHSILKAIESVASREQHAAELILATAIFNDNFQHDTNLQRDMLDILFEACSLTSEQILAKRVRKLSVVGDENQQGENSAQQQRPLRLALIFVQSLTKKALAEESIMTERIALIESILLHLPPSAFSKTNYDRLSAPLESVLKLGAEGEGIFQKVVEKHLLNREFGDQKIDASVQSLKKEFFNQMNLDSLNSKSVINGQQSQSEGHRERYSHVMRGWALLMVTLIYQLCSEDEDALELLNEARAMLEDFGVKNIGQHTSLAADDVDEERRKKAADAVVDLCVTLASKPSRLLRRMSLLVFQYFADLVTFQGLGSLGNIVRAKENREGQQELFADGADSEAETDESGTEDDGDPDNDDSDKDSHIEDMDSDVEVISAPQSEDKNEDSETDTDSEPDEDEDEDSESDDQALVDLDKALATALGTRAFTQADLEAANSSSDSDSDLDMTDSEMAPLDEKLAELFRNRVTQKSTEKTKAQERKIVKENIVNLKNRALDMLEAYLQTVLQSRLGRGLECVEVVLMLFDAAKVANGQQVASKALGIAESWLKKCRGAKIPDCEPWSESEDGVTEALATSLQKLHTEVLVTETRNDVVHVAAQLNILIANMLVRAGKNKAEVIALVKETGRDTYVGSEEKSLDRSSKKEKEKQKYLKHKRSKGKEAYEDLWKRFEAWAAENMPTPTRPVKQPSADKVDGNTSGSKQTKRDKKKAHKKSISAS